MEQWLREKFEIEVIDGEENIKFRIGGKTRYAPISAVLSLFGASVAPPTASSLKSFDPENILGWHENIDAWAAAGFFN
jgi:hypothetical protein